MDKTMDNVKKQPSGLKLRRHEFINLNLISFLNCTHRHKFQVGVISWYQLKMNTVLNSIEYVYMLDISVRAKYVHMFAGG
jgi:hypothetical protein